MRNKLPKGVFVSLGNQPTRAGRTCLHLARADRPKGKGVCLSGYLMPCPRQGDRGYVSPASMNA